MGNSGSSTLPAVLGRSSGNTGLHGYSGPAFTVPASPAKTAVYGFANADAGSVGLPGRSPTGRGGVLVAVDRLLHHAHVIVTKGQSHRLAEVLDGRGVMPLEAADG